MLADNYTASPTLPMSLSFSHTNKQNMIYDWMKLVTIGMFRKLGIVHLRNWMVVQTEECFCEGNKSYSLWGNVSNDDHSNPSSHQALHNTFWQAKVEFSE